ncbi:hypothetical protein LAZ67_3004791 [Cordylochernes scorpioides]|uniref:CENP-T/Histone H4 histone fold domain-containing protein n=1 Tax=Cordylochernes scorpioides TaxID=51811 RepID=A0ABY6K9S9_9ARAC|nr:hypothetical protein LAZ67_3004791 [Cordylochernes scorpioides]
MEDLLISPAVPNKDTFGADRVISRHFIHQWPPRSPDLTPCDFWLWGYIKSRVYRCRPTTLAMLKASIRWHVLSISTNILFNAVHSVIYRLQAVFENEGRHIEQGLDFSRVVPGLMNQHPYCFKAGRYFLDPSQLTSHGKARRRKEEDKPHSATSNLSSKHGTPPAPDFIPESTTRIADIKKPEEQITKRPRSKTLTKPSDPSTSKDVSSATQTTKGYYWKEHRMKCNFEEEAFLRSLKDYTYGGEEASAFRLQGAQMWTSAHRSSSESSCSSYGVCQRFQMEKEQGTDPESFYNYDNSLLPRPESPSISSSDNEVDIGLESDDDDMVENSYEEYKQITDIFNLLKISSQRLTFCNTTLPPGLGICHPLASKKEIPKPRISSSLVRCLFKHFCSYPIAKEVYEVLNDYCDLYFKQMVRDLESYCEKENRNVITGADMDHLLKKQRGNLRKEIAEKLSQNQSKTRTFPI